MSDELSLDDVRWRKIVHDIGKLAWPPSDPVAQLANVHQFIRDVLEGSDKAPQAASEDWKAHAEAAEAALTIAQAKLDAVANTLDTEAADLRQRAKTERDGKIAAQLFGEEHAKADAAARIRKALLEQDHG